MKNHSNLLGIGALMIVIGLGVGPASAQDVIQGLDLLTSQVGTAADFSNNPIPPGFFGCGAGFSGAIPLGGDPIRGSQNLYSTDTILDRMNTVPGGTGGTGLRIIGLCLKNVSWAGPCGNLWKVYVRLDPNRQQPVTALNMQRVDSNGGTFDAELVVLSEVWFHNAYDSSDIRGPVTDDVVLITTGATWKYNPGRNDVVVNGPLQFDVLCDGGLAGYSPYGTSNFFPGTVVNHSGPHPVKPAKECEPIGSITATAVPTDPSSIDPRATHTTATSTSSTSRTIDASIGIGGVAAKPACADVVYEPVRDVVPRQLND